MGSILITTSAYICVDETVVYLFSRRMEIFVTVSDALEYLFCPRFIFFMHCLGVAQREERRFTASHPLSHVCALHRPGPRAHPGPTRGRAFLAAGDPIPAAPERLSV